jgi:hypothetical protein
MEVWRGMVPASTACRRLPSTRRCDNDPSDGHPAELERNVYAPDVAALARIEPPVDRAVLDRPDLLLGREGKLSVFYGPFDSVNTDARIVLLGLTPGWTQLRIALDAYCSAIRSGASDAAAQVAAKHAASFAGMRIRLVRWLDDIGVPQWLGIPTTSYLFEDDSLLHTTSLVRYPVFVGEERANYRGASPRPAASSLLRELIRNLLVPELASIPDALVVPLGSAVSAAVSELDIADPGRCLIGFPHPSGANGWADRHFAKNRDQLRRTVADMRH